jgi:hypothetical protein
MKIDGELVRNVVMTGKRRTYYKAYHDIIDTANDLQALRHFASQIGYLQGMYDNAHRHKTDDYDNQPPPYIDDIYSNKADMIDRWHKSNKDYDYSQAYAQYIWYKTAKDMHDVPRPNIYSDRIHSDVWAATIALENEAYRLSPARVNHNWYEQWEEYLDYITIKKMIAYNK